uniref:EGF-like domain-containing protein n=1 Tax=Trichuris muris TaxID=70415 RepID=A0A5S6QRJ4_TRIMR
MEIKERFIGKKLTLQGKTKCLTWLTEPQSHEKLKRVDICKLFLQGEMVSLANYSDVKEALKELGTYKNRTLMGKTFRLDGRVVSIQNDELTFELPNQSSGQAKIKMKLPPGTLNKTVDGYLPKPLCAFFQVGYDDLKLLDDCYGTKVEGRLCLSEEITAKSSESNKVICPPGRKGPLCLNYNDPCKAPNPCQHYGECISTDKEKITCVCISRRYTGDRCEKVVSLCKGYNCGTGKCVEVRKNRHLQPKCNCETGMTGASCDQKVDFCKGVYCEFNGTCTSGASDYACQCTEGHGGKNCDTVIPSTGSRSKIIIIAAAASGAVLLFLFACGGLFLLYHRKKTKRRKPDLSGLAMSSTMESSIAGRSVLDSDMKSSAMRSTVASTYSLRSKRAEL